MPYYRHLFIYPQNYNYVLKILKILKIKQLCEIQEFYRKPQYPQNCLKIILNILKIKKCPLNPLFHIVIVCFSGAKKPAKNGAHSLPDWKHYLLAGGLMRVVQWAAPASSSHASAVPPKDRRPVAG